MEETSASLSMPNFEGLLKDYRAADRRLLIFDYDGTLTPIVSDPEKAVPSPHLITCLKAISKERKNDVWIISGRDCDFLDRQFANVVPTVNLIAEHGCWLKRAQYADQSAQWESMVDSGKRQLDNHAITWVKFLAEFFPGSSYEEKSSSVTWHYRNIEYDESMMEFLIAATRQHVSKHDRLELVLGKKIIEIRPRVCNKGNSVEVALKNGPFQFIWCAGDDKTDEDMFKYLASLPMEDPKPIPTTIHTCHVGEPTDDTIAEFSIATPCVLRLVLTQMMWIDM